MLRATKRNKSNKIRVIAVLIVAALIITLADIGLRDSATEVSAYRAQMISQQAIYSAVADTLGENGAQYAELVRIIYDNDGNISSIETDSYNMNLIKLEVTRKVNERLEALERERLNVPLGTITGLQLLSGRGPDIRFKMLPASYAKCEFYHSFESAGINQTRHQIYLTINVAMTAIISTYSSSVEVSDSICIAETVIVGTVPQTYASFF